MKAGAKGCKTQVKGRVGGAEIARAEQYREGVLSLHTLTQDIDYALAEAHTTYGRLGCKVWISRPDAATLKELANREQSERRFDRRRPREEKKELTNLCYNLKELSIEDPHGLSYEGLSKAGNEVSFGEYGLQATSGNYITNKQIEAARIVLARYTKRSGQIWIRIYPHLEKQRNQPKFVWVLVKVQSIVGSQ